MLGSLKVKIDEINHASKKPRLDKSFTITQRTSECRQINPSSSSSTISTRYKRQNETIIALSQIHGIPDTKSNTLLSIIFDTLCSNFSNLAVTDEILNTNDPDRPPNTQSVSNTIKTKIITDASKTYFTSDANKFRSLFIFYSRKYIMSSRQYQAQRQSHRQATLISPDPFCKNLPNLIPYKELQYTINHIDIGPTHSTLTIEKITQGCYRRLDTFVLRLAQFYLNRDRDMTRHDKLIDFPSSKKRDTDSFLFVLSFGGDAAPGCGTSFLVAFLNVGERLANSSEHFIVF